MLLSQRRTGLTSFQSISFRGCALALGIRRPQGLACGGLVEGVVLKALRAKRISPGGAVRCARLETFLDFCLFYDRKTRNFEMGTFSVL